jgi:poly-gamma-glutamate capsule biosynthesis protein CapA/YwtB (metallophosphatase superfamily)
LAALVAGLTLAGCGDSTRSATEQPAEPPPAAANAAGASPITSAEPTAAPAPVTLAFAGDVHFEDDVRTRLADPATTLAPIADVLSAADLTVVNLETAITERGTPEPKTYAFRVGPVALDALAAAGVDVVTMANNHAVDYGRDGLTDTLAAVESSPLPVVGIGADEDQAFAPAVLNVRGTAIAVLGATEVPDRTAAAWSAGPDSAGVASARDPARILSAVSKAADSADVVVVYLHYGEEQVSCPTDEQRDLVSALATAGADVVVGSHAHVLLGAGWLGATYVSYGLGNFVWYTPNSTAEATSGVLTLTLRDGAVVDDDWAPTFTGQDGMPRLVTGANAKQAVAEWAALRDCTDLSGRLDGAEAMG